MMLFALSTLVLSGLSRATGPALTPPYRNHTAYSNGSVPTSALPSDFCCIVYPHSTQLEVWWSKTVEVTVATVITQHIQYNNTSIRQTITTLAAIGEALKSGPTEITFPNITQNVSIASALNISSIATRGMTAVVGTETTRLKSLGNSSFVMTYPTSYFQINVIEYQTGTWVSSHGLPQTCDVRKTDSAILPSTTSIFAMSNLGTNSSVNELLRPLMSVELASSITSSLIAHDPEITRRWPRFDHCGIFGYGSIPESPRTGTYQVIVSILTAQSETTITKPEIFTQTPDTDAAPFSPTATPQPIMTAIARPTSGAHDPKSSVRPYANGYDQVSSWGMRHTVGAPFLQLTESALLPSPETPKPAAGRPSASAHDPHHGSHRVSFPHVVDASPFESKIAIPANSPQQLPPYASTAHHIGPQELHGGVHTNKLADTRPKSPGIHDLKPAPTGQTSHQSGKLQGAIEAYLSNYQNKFIGKPRSSIADIPTNKRVSHPSGAHAVSGIAFASYNDQNQSENPEEALTPTVTPHLGLSDPRQSFRPGQGGKDVVSGKSVNSGIGGALASDDGVGIGGKPTLVDGVVPSNNGASMSRMEPRGLLLMLGTIWLLRL